MPNRRLSLSSASNCMRRLPDQASKCKIEDLDSIADYRKMCPDMTLMNKRKIGFVL